MAWLSCCAPFSLQGWHPREPDSGRLAGGREGLPRWVKHQVFVAGLTAGLRLDIYNMC